MATAKDIITKAESYIGTKEVPSGSNNVIFNTHYYGGAVSGAAYPWCMAFVWDIFRMCGASDLAHIKTAYCPAYENAARTAGESVDLFDGQYGDVVLFDFSGKRRLAGHVGFIVENLGNGRYITIEGNTSVTSNDNGGAVMRRTRTTGVIKSIMRPKYAKESGVAIPTRAKATVEDIARQVIAGKWGNDPQRTEQLKADGYDVQAVQIKVNELLKPTEKVAESKVESVSSVDRYIVGKTYALQVELTVRTGPGTNYRAKKRSELTADGQKHDVDRDGCLDKGTRTTCLEVKQVGYDTWLRTPSGWLAAVYKGHEYIA